MDASYRAEALEKTRDAHRGVVGFFSNYVPEEWLYACDLIPTRLLGLQEHRCGDGSSLPGFYCSYVRDVYASIEQGLLGYLDAVVLPNTCDSLQGVRDVWAVGVPDTRMYPFLHPVRQAGSREFYVAQLVRLRKAISADFRVDPSPAALARAAEVYNRNRSVLARLHARRLGKRLPFGGADFVALVTAGMILPKEEHNQMLEELERGQDPSAGELLADKHRLMIMGPVCDRLDLLDVIESKGAVIVTDALTNGTRYFLYADLELPCDDVAFARRFERQAVSPTVTTPERWGFVVDQARSFRAEGLIFICPKYWDPHILLWPAVRLRLEAIGIPTLVLEIEHNQSDFSREGNLVEAFLETLQPV